MIAEHRLMPVLRKLPARGGIIGAGIAAQREARHTPYVASSSAIAPLKAGDNQRYGPTAVIPTLLNSPR